MIEILLILLGLSPIPIMIMIYFSTGCSRNQSLTTFDLHLSSAKELVEPKPNLAERKGEI